MAIVKYNGPFLLTHFLKNSAQSKYREKMLMFAIIVSQKVKIGLYNPQGVWKKTTHLKETSTQPKMMTNPLFGGEYWIGGKRLLGEFWRGLTYVLSTVSSGAF